VDRSIEFDVKGNEEIEEISYHDDPSYEQDEKEYI
jgi:hypothetical protein